MNRAQHCGEGVWPNLEDRGKVEWVGFGNFGAHTKKGMPMQQ